MGLQPLVFSFWWAEVGEPGAFPLPPGEGGPQLVAV